MTDEIIATYDEAEPEQGEHLYSVRHTNVDMENEEVFKDKTGVVETQEADYNVNAASEEELAELADRNAAKKEESKDEKRQVQPVLTEESEGDDFVPSNHWEETAINQGWRPEAEFEGNAEDWRDARSFVEKGELFNVIHSMKRDAKVTKQALLDQSSMIEMAADNARNKLLAELKEARIEAKEEQDYAREDKINDKIDELKTKAKESKEKAVEDAPAQEPTYVITPMERAEWMASNPWYSMDQVAANSANMLSESYLQSKPEATGREILEYVSSTMRNSRPDLFVNKNRSKPSTVSRAQTTVAKAQKASAKNALPGYNQLMQAHKKQCDDYVASTGLTRKQWIKDFHTAGGFEEYNK